MFRRTSISGKRAAHRPFFTRFPPGFPPRHRWWRDGGGGGSGGGGRRGLKAVGVGEERGKREERTAVATFVIYDRRYSLSPHRLRRAHTRQPHKGCALSLSLSLLLSRHPFTRFPSTLFWPLRGLTSVSPEQGGAGGEMCTREMRSGRCRCCTIIGRVTTTRDKRRLPFRYRNAPLCIATYKSRDGFPFISRSLLFFSPSLSSGKSFQRE